MSDLSEAAARANTYSPFLSSAMARHPDIVHAASADSEAAVALALSGSDDVVGKRLRRQRDRLALALALEDLAGRLSLEEVVGVLSDFADRALDEAIREATGSDDPGFVAIALGKHGGRELNYSSDIDPIFLFDPERLRRRPRAEPQEAAVRVARRVVETLQARDTDGYVFRVDLRLRPAPEVTPIALPLQAAIGHYESSALGWERAAFVKARSVAGALDIGDQFLTAVKPFVWRRALDFGAIEELRSLTARIRAHHHDGQILGPGFDLKRGRGGIREIEFFTQIHQLIHGGRDERLRVRGTLPALAALAEAGVVPPEDAATLAAAYRLLRTIEHRLQMVDDRQTHALPRELNALDGVARLHGLAGGDALLALLRPHVAAVEQLYDALEGEGGTRPTVDFAAFAAPEAARGTLRRWRDGGVRSLRSPAAIAAFDRIEPPLLAAVAATPEPDATLGKLERLLDRLPSGVTLFRLLHARPALLETLLSIVAHAPPLADALAAKPALLDRLVDRSAHEPVPETVALAAQMRVEGGLETQLDQVRHWVGEHRFALGTQLLEGEVDPIDVAQGHARVAEAALSVVAASVVAEFEQAHGRVPGGELIVLALGRLGGGELTHASDLDLVFLFTGDHLSESDGPRPLGATHYFNRLAARIGTALSAPTAAGALYEVDTRLRPSGAKGPLAVTLDSFERYGREDAWTWERMALTRARPVFGGARARADVAAAVARVLGKTCEPDRLRLDVRTMREDMRKSKPVQGPFDLKLGPGGLVDLEFIVHHQQLATQVGLQPSLPAAIAALAEAGLLEPKLGQAYALLDRLLITLRLVAPDLATPPFASRALVARACRFDDWDALTAALTAARKDVRTAWNGLFGRDDDG